MARLKFGTQIKGAGLVFGPNIVPASTIPVFTGNIASKAGNVGDVVSIDISNEWTGTPTSYTVATGVLPAGLTLSNAGVISGTLTTIQSLSGISITGTNTSGSDTSNTFSWSVAAAVLAPVFTGTIANQAGTEGDLVNLDVSGLVSNSPTSYSLNVAGTSAGLSISNVGVITGTLPAAQTITGIVVTATNSGGSDDSNAFNWVVSAALWGFSGTLVNGSTGIPVSGEVGMKVIASSTFDGPPIGTAITFATNANGVFSVVYPGTANGSTYFVGITNAGETVTALHKWIAGAT